MASRLEARAASADLAPLQEVVRRIVASWAPTQIWLFGSRARGAAAPDSDWDLLVVVPDGIDDRDLDSVSAWKIGRIAASAPTSSRAGARTSTRID